jgi:hypothetical protein
MGAPGSRVHAGGRPPSRFIEHAGQRKSLTEWAREVGVTTATLRYRLQRWTVAEALNAPPHYRPRYQPR